MGGGILSGLMWGTMTSVIVLGVVSQMAPLPPSALEDVAVVTPRAGDPVAQGAGTEVVDQVAGAANATTNDLTSDRVAGAVPDPSEGTLPLPDSLSGIVPSRVAQGTGPQALPVPSTEPGQTPSATPRTEMTVIMEAKVRFGFR